MRIILSLVFLLPLPIGCSSKTQEDDSHKLSQPPQENPAPAKDKDKQKPTKLIPR